MNDPITVHIPPEAASLRPFVDAGVLRVPEVQVAAAVARSVPGTPHEVLLAAALCVRALQLGHVCVALDEALPGLGAERAGDSDPSSDGDSEADHALDAAVAALVWPEPAAWAAALGSAAAVVVRDAATGGPATAVVGDVTLPLVFDGRRVYLERYWRYERQVGDRLISAAAEDDLAASGSLDAVLDTYFGADDPAQPDLQRRAASVALRRRVTVVAGGPGTGKTYTVARLLAAAHQLAIDAGRPLVVALAAPTGKAAARMSEAVHQAVTTASLPPEVAGPLLATEAGTIHRLLGWRDGMSFRHDHTDPLPHDLVVIDETSMVDLPLMAKVLDALRPQTRLVLVGDPFQLASVEAGAVMGDIVGPAARGPLVVSGKLEDSIVVLDRVHRFGSDSAIARLADSVRTGDVDGALDVLRDPSVDDVTLIDPGDADALTMLRREVAKQAAIVVRAAHAGDAEAAMAAALDLKVLCGTRWGPLGSYGWRDEIERRLGRLVPGVRTDRRWYVGRPVIVTRNDYVTGVFNGDTGIVILRDDRPVVAAPSAAGMRELAPSQLAELETWWAMTVHKSQGSEFAHAVVSLPAAGSRILSNELLYTGITRGKERVTLVATEAAVRAAILQPITRASGLHERLWG